MKTIILAATAFLASAASSSPMWAAHDSIDAPESVHYDLKSNQIFVSNISGAGNEKDGRGWIQILNTNGQVIKDKWIEGLNAPKGMRAHNGLLWVTDIDSVLAFEIQSGRMVKKISVANSKFLNDVAITDDGDVFVSDTLGRVIYRIRGDHQEVFFQGDETESPNGLLIRSDELIVAAWGLAADDWSTTVAGRLYSLNLQTGQKTLITKDPLGNLDGLEVATDGSYIVSDWVSGKIYKISIEGFVSTFLIDPIPSAADIGYIPATDTLLIPYMNKNEVRAFNLKTMTGSKQ